MPPKTNKPQEPVLGECGHKEMQFSFFLILKGSSTSSLKKYTRLKIYERTHLIKTTKKKKKIQSHCYVIHVSPHHWLLHSDKGRWGKLVDAHRNREGFLLWLCTGLNKVTQTLLYNIHSKGSTVWGKKKSDFNTKPFKNKWNTNENFSCVGHERLPGWTVDEFQSLWQLLQVWWSGSVCLPSLTCPCDCGVWGRIKGLGCTVYRLRLKQTAEQEENKRGFTTIRWWWLLVVG